MAFDFYFAGSQNLTLQALKYSLGCNELRSYMTEKCDIKRLIQAKKDGVWKSGKLMIDSGAFTIHRKGGEIDIDQYINWLNEQQEYVDYAIQLDKIAGVWGTPRTAEQLADAPVQSWENYLYMRERLVRPDMLLPVFHQGENWKFLTQMLEYRSPEGSPVAYIAISGNKELTNEVREAWYYECWCLIHKSSNPNIKVHCLGSATMRNMQKYPFTSSDATTWIMSGANGCIITDCGVVLVSDRSIHDPEHLHNRGQEAIDKIQQMCKEFDVDYEKLPNSYEARLAFNIHFIQRQSKTTEFVPRKFTNRRLF